MKTRITLALLAGLTLGKAVHAQPNTHINNYPVTAPNCNVAVSQPDNSSGYYLNDTCKVGFVLPPKSGVVRVESVNAIGNLEMCPGLSKARLRVAKYQDQVDKLLDRLATARLSAQEQEEIRKNIALINGIIGQQVEPFDGVPAATAQVSYTYPSTDEWIGQFYRLNPNIGADYGMKFVPAKISEGILVFSAIDQIEGKVKLSPVVKANIPGMHPAGSDPTKLTGTAIVANGDSSGQVILSLAGACGSKIEKMKEVTADDAQDFAANLVANVTYVVDVMGSVGYVATLDSDIALTNWTKSISNKTQFSKDEAAELFSAGEAGVAFQFTVKDFGSHSTDEDKANFYAKTRDEARTRLASALVDQMELAGFLEMNAAAPRADAPAPGTVDEVRTRTECHSSSGFLGIGGSSSCSQVPYIVKVPHGSSASVLLSKINNTNFTNKEEVVINQMTPRVHTGSFLPAKK